MSCVTQPAGALARPGVSLQCVSAIPVAPAAPACEAVPVFEQPPPGTPNLTGKWAMPKPITHLLTSDGSEPPLNAAGKAEYDQRQAALQAGNTRSIRSIPA